MKGSPIAMRFLTLDRLAVAGRRVLVRSDLNVPLEGGVITDDFRIRAALPTIERLRAEGAVVTVCSHLGRPKGPDPALRLDPVAARLAELGGFAVRKLDGVVGPEVEAAVAAAGPGDVIVLENTRFEPGETKNDAALAAGLAALGDVFVQDAFGSVHRAHASTVGVAERLRSAAGLVLEAELRSLGAFLGEPERPYVVVLGGAKISDKLAVIENLLPRVDTMLVGGGMCFTLLAARGLDVGESLVELDMIERVRSVLDGPDRGKILLPVDIVVADRFAADAAARTVTVEGIPTGWRGLDIGPLTADLFAGAVRAARSVFWNGPMGVFEWPIFRAGTDAVARAVAACDGFTVVGGGDSVAAVRLLGVEGEISHVSTGGGAGLELLEGIELPGVKVLEQWV